MSKVFVAVAAVSALTGAPTAHGDTYSCNELRLARITDADYRALAAAYVHFCLRHVWHTVGDSDRFEQVASVIRC
jgi:hypothetical protein